MLGVERVRGAERVLVLDELRVLGVERVCGAERVLVLVADELRVRDVEPLPTAERLFPVRVPRTLVEVLLDPSREDL